MTVSSETMIDGAAGPAGADQSLRWRSNEPSTSAISEWKEILADLREYRFLLYQLALRDVKIRYKQAVMGFFWAVFMPAVVVLAGLLVRYAMSYISGSAMDTTAVAGLAIKAVAWSFFVGAIGFATNSLSGNVNLITKIYFPREVLPLASDLAQAFDSSVGAVALAVVLPFLGIQWSWNLLWIPVLTALLFLFTVAVSLFLSCANLFFRDVKYIVQVLLTFGIFFTPVFFEPSMFGAHGAQLLMLNPLSPILEGLRLSVVEGHSLFAPLVETVKGQSILTWTPWYLAYTSAWVIGGGLGSSLLFHRLEFVFAEYA